MVSSISPLLDSAVIGQQFFNSETTGKAAESLL
jgi:hypothetical protein